MTRGEVMWRENVPRHEVTNGATAASLSQRCWTARDHPLASALRRASRRASVSVCAPPPPLLPLARSRRGAVLRERAAAACSCGGSASRGGDVRMRAGGTATCQARLPLLRRDGELEEEEEEWLLRRRSRRRRFVELAAWKWCTRTRFSM